MKYLSFSLWGDKPLYNVGTIRNAELWKTIYPDWQMIVYYDNSVPVDTITKLKELDVITIDMTGQNIYGCFWRFLVSNNNDCEYAIFRDSDSRVSEREKLAVDEWINSGKSLHVMRDHPAHGIPYGNNSIGILAGMWGIKGNIYNFTHSINEFIKGKNDYYGIDQSFLKIIYSLYENDNTTHDDFFLKKPFPIKRVNGRFIGERIGIDENPVTNDYKILLNK
jgi:hypothetical protein